MSTIYDTKGEGWNKVPNIVRYFCSDSLRDDNIGRNCDVLPLLFDDLLKYNINVSFTLKNKIKSQTAQIEFHKCSKKLASGVEVV